MIRPTPKKVPAPEAGCPLQDCLQLMAGAWTAEIIWYLQAGPRRFGDLQRDLGRVSAKVLTTRLRELEQRGVLLRTVHPTKPPTVEYSLTEVGTKLRPVMDALANVGKELRESGTAPRPTAAKSPGQHLPSSQRPNHRGIA